MQAYLAKSIASKLVKGVETKLNQNKLNGLLAEVAFREYLTELGFADRVSPGGWIVRSEGAGTFGHATVVLFPETVEVEKDYLAGRTLPEVPVALHSIAQVFREAGIPPYF